MSFNPMDHSNKDEVLDVIRTEKARFDEVVNDPDNWYVETRCEGWQVRDIVGHMIDVTEGYLQRWELAEKGDLPDGAGLVVMADRLNEGALAKRELSREEALARLDRAYHKMQRIFEGLDAEAWNNFLVAHPFMGPAPTLFYPAFQIMDYGVHTWDMNWGLGDKDAKLDERTAGVLVPYMFILWSATVDQEKAKGVDLTYGIEADGEWGGKWKINIKDGEFKWEAVDDLSDVPAVWHFDHVSDLVLSTYQRFRAGEVRGDKQVIDQAHELFFTI